MGYWESYEEWCHNPIFDNETRQELQAIRGDEKEIEDRFYRELEFGTGGLRGIIGNGTNRMNRYTIRKVTQGLANFIIKEKGQNRGVAIAYDSRHMSAEFGREAALCLNANGIKTYIFASLRPTPVLSFAVRELSCIAGIVITASHNPPEYNGYKVYWEDGGQITAPKDGEILAEVKGVKDYSAIKTMVLSEAIEKGRYHMIGKEMDEAYIEALKKLVLDWQSIRRNADLKIVYSPLHGTGNQPVQRILQELGFKNVYIVKEQEEPDGDFPTVRYPNPEDREAFALALKLAGEVEADIILATDPDADRLGVYVRDLAAGEYRAFTGNMSGVLIGEYLLARKAAAGTLGKKSAILKTIVTTKMADKMAAEYGADSIEVLTGFKYIGEQIRLFEETNSHEYVFGFEESYGCLVGTHARDKDGVAAVMILCEAAAFYRGQGLSLWEQMQKLYEKYGYFKESLVTITLNGRAGSERMKAILEYFRHSAPLMIGDNRVLAVRDYQSGQRKDLITGAASDIRLPKSDVLYFELENDGWYCLRPSGTEPKMKVYFGVKGQNQADSEEKLKALESGVLKFIEPLMK